MNNKRRILGCLCLGILVFLASGYLAFLHHPPAAETLKNQKSQPAGAADKFDLDPNTEHTMAEISRAAWGKWLVVNNYVSIGEVFDGPCGK